MVKIVSRVYSNQSLIIFNEKICFKNGCTEISEELWNKIKESKFPNIFKEGEEPEYKTKLEENLRKEFEESNEEYENEITRLKNVITSLKNTIAQKDEEIEEWKMCVENLKNNKQSFIEKKTETKENDEDQVLKDELMKMKKDELIELAKSEDGGNFTEEDLKGKTKEEIVSMIIEKSK